MSYAQNREDVVLYRALSHITQGRYLDVGANDPTVDSVTKAFHDRGWRGMSIDPIEAYAQAHRDSRDGDIVVQAAVTDADVDEIELHMVPDTGLSSLRSDVADAYLESGAREVRNIIVPARRLTRLLDEAGWDGLPIHFMNLDVEGAELNVLNSLDLSRYRPWVMLIESLAPHTAEPAHEVWESTLTSQGYTFALFDGLSRFYVADEHLELLDALSVPANIMDNSIPLALHNALQVPDQRHELAQIYARNDALQEQIRETAEAQRDEQAWLKEQVDTGSWQLAEVRQALTHLEKINADLTAHRDDLLHERTAMQQEQTTMQQEQTAMQQEQTTMRQEQTTMRQELEELLARVERLQEQLAEAEASALTWRTKAVSTWADFSAYRETSGPELDAARASEAAARQEIVDIKNSTSWRVTKALRAVGGRLPH